MAERKVEGNLIWLKQLQDCLNQNYTVNPKVDREKWVSIKASGTEQNVSLMKYPMH